MKPKIQALVTCQNKYCAEEQSYTLDMVRMWDGLPICECCYIDGDYAERDDDGYPKVRWDDLPPVTLKDLGK